jgi:hypothetical protein
LTTRPEKWEGSGYPGTARNGARKSMESGSGGGRTALALQCIFVLAGAAVIAACGLRLALCRAVDFLD